jgi:translation initiation factor IF-2
MSEERIHKIRQAMQEFNLGLDTIVEFLHRNGSPIERSPVAKLTEGELDLLRKEYSSSAQEKREASGISIGHKHNEKIVIEGDSHKERRKTAEDEIDEAPVSRRINMTPPSPPRPQPQPAPVPVQAPPTPPPAPELVVPPPTPTPAPPTPTVASPSPVEPELIKAEGQVQGLKVLGKIDLSAPRKAAPKPKEADPVPAEKPVEDKVIPPTPTIATELPVESPPPSPDPVIAEVVEEEKVAHEPAKIPEPEPDLPETPVAPAEEIQGVIKAGADQLKGLTVLGKIDLKAFENKPKSPSESRAEEEKKKIKNRASGCRRIRRSCSAETR